MAEIQSFIDTFLGLLDTPAPYVADRFLRVNSVPDATIFFDLFGTANTWTADQTHAADILANVDDSRNIGTQATRFATVRAVNGAFVQGDGSVVFGAGQGGLIAGRSQQGPGSSTMTLGGAYPPVALMGHAFTSLVTHTSDMTHRAGGGVMFGSAFCGGNGTKTATMESQDAAYGCFVGGYAFASGGSGATSRINNAGAGSFLWAYVAKTGAGTSLAQTSGAGAFLSGRITGGGTHTFTASGSGSFAQGILSGSGSSQITSSGSGAFAQGRANVGGIIRATSNGAFAQGNANANGCIIDAGGLGSFAHGHASGGFDITASGQGSLAIGSAVAANITASSTNSFQFGEGANALADSMQVGAAGIRFKGTAGAPGTPQNGDIWVAGGFVYIRSNGVSVQI